MSPLLDIIPSLNDRLHQMDATVNRLHEENDNLQGKVDDMSDNLSRLNELKSELVEAQEDNVRLQKQNSSYEYDLSVIRNENDQLHALNENNTKELESFERRSKFACGSSFSIPGEF